MVEELKKQEKKCNGASFHALVLGQPNPRLIFGFIAKKIRASTLLGVSCSGTSRVTKTVDFITQGATPLEC